MGSINKRVEGRLKRKKRIRGKVSGTAKRPRLTVYKSLKHLYAQVIDDVNGTTIAAASTLSKDLKEQMKTCAGFQGAELIGITIADSIAKKGVAEIVFDRNGYKFHGKIKALVESVKGKGIVV